MRIDFGQHMGTFSLPTGEHAAGVLILEQGRGPRVELVAEKGLQDPGDEFSILGPALRFDAMDGWLRSNLDLRLGPGYIGEFLPRQMVAGAKWVVVGFDLASAESGWTKVKVRLTGLDHLVGSRLTERRIPFADAEDRTYTVRVAQDGGFESEADGIRIVAGQDLVTNFGNPHAFILESYASATFTSEGPVPLVDWLDDWIRPLLTLVSLGTGQYEHLSTVLLETDGKTGEWADRARGHLYAEDISQDDVKSSMRMTSDGRQVVPLFKLSDAPPLVELIKSWRSGGASDSALSLHRHSLDEDIPEQVRFLMKVQALEALDTADHEDKEGPEFEAHKERFNEIVDDLRRTEDTSAAAFLEAHAQARFGPSLETRLERLCKQIPGRRKLKNQIGEALATAKAFLDSQEEKDHDPPLRRIAAIRNLLSHGQQVPHAAVREALGAADRLLSLDLLRRLGFSDPQLLSANEAIRD